MPIKEKGSKPPAVRVAAKPFELGADNTSISQGRLFPSGAPGSGTPLSADHGPFLFFFSLGEGILEFTSF